jgi:hypothetical protein
VNCVVGIAGWSSFLLGSKCIQTCIMAHVPCMIIFWFLAYFCGEGEVGVMGMRPSQICRQCSGMVWGGCMGEGAGLVSSGNEFGV